MDQVTQEFVKLLTHLAKADDILCRVHEILEEIESHLEWDHPRVGFVLDKVYQCKKELKGKHYENSSS